VSPVVCTISVTVCGPSRSASIMQRREGSEKPRNNFACSSIVLELGSSSMELLGTNAKYQQMLILYSTWLRPVFATRCSAANCFSWPTFCSRCFFVRMLCTTIANIPCGSALISKKNILTFEGVNLVFLCPPCRTGRCGKKCNFQRREINTF